MKKDWLKLKENICPVCGNKLARVLERTPYECSRCQFYCRYNKAQKIIADVEYKKKITFQDRLADDWVRANT